MNAEAPMQGSSQRLPPANLKAEQALLGALLSSNKTFERVREFLKPEHFADPVNGRVFAAISRRVEAGQLADVVTLKSEFEHSGVLAEVGGTQYLASLLGAMVSQVAAGDYGCAIHDAWLRRELIEVGESLVNSAFGVTEPMLSASALVVDVVDRLLALSAEGATPRKAIELDAAIVDVMESSEAARRGDRRPGLVTGISSLDLAWRGLWAGCLDIVGARPGAGKTALLTQISTDVARHFLTEDIGRSRRVQLFSLEMGASEIAARILAGEARVTTDDLREGQYDVPAGDRLVRAQRGLRSLPLDIIDQRGQTLADIAITARIGVRRQGVGLVPIDHLLKVQPDRHQVRLPLTERLRAATSALKDLAGDLGVPVILAHQLGRDVERRDDPRPHLSDMLNAGEQDADNVILMWRPEVHLRSQEPTRGPTETEEHFARKQATWVRAVAQVGGLTEFCFVKRRNGPQATVRVPFDETRMRFGTDAPSADLYDDSDLRGEPRV